MAAFLAMAAAILITISTSGDFQRKWQANRTAAAEIEREAYDFLATSGATPRGYLDRVARAGDIVVFDFSHIGVVVADQLSLADKISTIEGNTTGWGERDSASGDGVWAKHRERTLTKSYIRIFFDQPGGHQGGIDERA